MDPDYKHQRPEVTYSGTALDKRYRDWLIHVNGVLHSKTSTAARLNLEGRFQELIEFIESHPN